MVVPPPFFTASDPLFMTSETPSTDSGTTPLQEQAAPVCVMSFNASDASGAGGNEEAAAGESGDGF